MVSVVQQPRVFTLKSASSGQREIHKIRMGGCQIHGPSLGTLNIRCRIIIGSQKGAIIFTTTHMAGLLRQEYEGCFWRRWVQS